MENPTMSTVQNYLRPKFSSVSGTPPEGFTVIVDEDGFLRIGNTGAARHVKLSFRSVFTDPIVGWYDFKGMGVYNVADDLYYTNDLATPVRVSSTLSPTIDVPASSYYIDGEGPAAGVMFAINTNTNNANIEIVNFISGTIDINFLA